MKTKTFLNLTNGLLYDGDFDGFIRIQSCQCERKAWNKIIMNVDDNFLMWLALGYDVRVVDYSMRKSVPRSLYQGLEWVWFCCCKSWKLPIGKIMVRDHNCRDYFEEMWLSLDDDGRNKLRYFRTFLRDPKKPTIICGKAIQDDNKEFFGKLAKEKL